MILAGIQTEMVPGLPHRVKPQLPNLGRPKVSSPSPPETIQAICASAALSSPRPPSNWLGSIPALPAFAVPSRTRLVTRPHSGRELFCYTVSSSRFRPPLLVPRPAHRRLPLDWAPHRLTPQGDEFPPRFAAVPATFPFTALHRIGIHSLPCAFGLGSVRFMDIRIRNFRPQASTKKLRASEGLVSSTAGLGEQSAGFAITSTLPQISERPPAGIGRFPSTPLWGSVGR
jgi:hypothetical protein